MRDFYIGLLTLLVRWTARPAAALSGDLPEDLVGSMRSLSASERTFAGVSDALGNIRWAAGLSGFASAVAGLALAVLGVWTDSTVLTDIGGLTLALVTAFGILLIIVRAREALGRRRFASQEQLPFAEVPPADPQSWDLGPVVLGYAAAAWILLRH